MGLLYIVIPSRTAKEARKCSPDHGIRHKVLLNGARHLIASQKSLVFPILSTLHLISVRYSALVALEHNKREDDIIIMAITMHTIRY